MQVEDARLKICVVGAGAIGGLMAVRLVRAGHDVTVVDRGTTLAAIRASGIEVIGLDGSRTGARMPSAGSVSEVPGQDLYVLAVKAHQIGGVAEELGRLSSFHQPVVPVQNGIPWWYFQKHGGTHEGRHLESVDPGGTIGKQLPADRIVGSVVYAAAESVSPGIVRHVEGDRISIGEIDIARTPRVELISRTLRSAGFKAPVVSDIRSDLWVKLLGSLSFNPISALTHATLDEICGFTPARELVLAMMREAEAVAEALGIRFRFPAEKRIAGAAAARGHKTSMLQDIEEGRTMEYGALVGSVCELGRITGIATPRSDAIHALVSLLDRTLQKSSGQLKVLPRE